MLGRGGHRTVARLLGAAAIAACVATPAAAQTAGAPELDPSAPMAPLPDLGVDWPDLDAPDDIEPASEGEPAAPLTTAPTGPTPLESADGRDIRYHFTIEGLQGIGDPAAILETFRKQSALEQGRKKGANAAQISRRSRADSELLVQILRSQGYYDARVEPRIEGSTSAVEVRLEAEP